MLSDNIVENVKVFIVCFSYSLFTITLDKPKNWLGQANGNRLIVLTDMCYVMTVVLLISQ